MYSQKDLDRFHSKYTKKSEFECWEWEAGKQTKGYGTFSLRKGNRKTYSAHRVAWEISNNQSIQNGMFICHKCDNPSCVNPSHLFLGTSQDNNIDTVNKSRAIRRIGESCSWTKLSDEDVEEIKHSDLKQSELARQYNVGQDHISRIKSGKRRNPKTKDFKIA